MNLYYFRPNLPAPCPGVAGPAGTVGASAEWGAGEPSSDGRGAGFSYKTCTTPPRTAQRGPAMVPVPRWESEAPSPRISHCPRPPDSDSDPQPRALQGRCTWLSPPTLMGSVPGARDRRLKPTSGERGLQPPSPTPPFHSHSSKPRTREAAAGLRRGPRNYISLKTLLSFLVLVLIRRDWSNPGLSSLSPLTANLI